MLQMGAPTGVYLQALDTVHQLPSRSLPLRFITLGWS